MTSTSAGAEARLRVARRRTLALSVALTLSSLAALTVVGGLPLFRASVAVPWWTLALGFGATELCVFHFEIDKDAHTFSLSEIPMVVALFYASPMALVVGRLVGEIVTLVVHDRQEPSKLLFNCSMFLAECTFATAVFRALAAGAGHDEPRAWIAALAAVVTADAISVVSVALAIRWHGAHPEPGPLLVAAGITAVANTSIALAAMLLLEINVAALGILAVVVAVLFAAYRAFTSLTDRYSSLERLYDFTTVVGATRSANSVVEALLERSRQVLRAERAEIHLFAGDGDHQPSVRLTMGADDELRVVDPVALFERDSKLVGSLGGQRRVTVVARGTRDESLGPLAEALGAKDCMVAPLSGAGGVIGFLAVVDRLGEISTFDAEDARLFQTLATHAEVALENGRLIDRLAEEATERERQALHDGLTDLPNRRYFLQKVEELTTGDAPVLGAAVMLMDLDRFKEVNDTLGHHNGDRLLEEVAVRLVASVPDGAAVARLGGDEFAVVIPGVFLPTEAVAIAERLRRALHQPVLLDEISLEVDASIGIALWPDDGDDVSTLLQRADVAMYAAKSNGRGSQLYDAMHDSHSPRRLALQNGLRQALDEGQLIAYYQPKARLADGAVIGVEALARWLHPEHGFLSPDEFIPMAERNGLIGSLTQHVLTTALSDCRRWNDSGLDIGVAVNLAARSLLDAHLVDDVAEILARTGVDPSRLTLEITEGSVIAEPKRSLHILERLAATGVQLSVDDFGTGYSSLSYLQQLPVHEVKIDKSFVLTLQENPQAATIAQAIVDLSRNLRLRAVAEGVEDAATWARLRGMGCAVGQGFLLSRPVAADAMNTWLAHNRVASPPHMADLVSLPRRTEQVAN